jgi:hypothetical protein
VGRQAPGQRGWKALALAKAAELGRKARALAAMEASLLHLAQSCHGDDRPDCPIIDTIAGGSATPVQRRARG